MKVAITVWQSIQTSHDTGKYVPVETRVFDLGTALGEIMLWANSEHRNAQWSDLVFSPVYSENGSVER